MATPSDPFEQQIARYLDSPIQEEREWARGMLIAKAKAEAEKASAEAAMAREKEEKAKAEAAKARAEEQIQREKAEKATTARMEQQVRLEEQTKRFKSSSERVLLTEEQRILVDKEVYVLDTTKPTRLSDQAVELLRQLLSSSGLSCEHEMYKKGIDKVFHEPIFHRAGGVKSVERFCKPSVRLAEESAAAKEQKRALAKVKMEDEVITPFLAMFFAIVGGIRFYVHDMHTIEALRHSKKRPDLTVSTTSDKPTLGVDSNIIVEVKQDSSFGTPEHEGQAYYYARELQRAMTYTRVYVILASDQRFRFMVLKDQELKLSGVYHVDDCDIRESQAVIALQAFLDDVKAESLPRPSLQDVNSNNEFTIDVSLVTGSLHLKKASQVYACGPDVLKHVTSQVAYDRELLALREVGQHPSLISLRAFSVNAPDRWLLLSPRGLYSLANYHGITNQSREIAVGQVLSAARWMHDHKYIHRDIRPDNVVVVSDTVYILIDLGHAVPGESYQDDHFIGVPLFAAHKHAKTLASRVKVSPHYTWDRITDLESIAKTFDFTRLAKSDQVLALGDQDGFQPWETRNFIGFGCWYDNFRDDTNLGYDELSSSIREYFRKPHQ